ncbi:MAG TPA: acetyl-CoA carboxylase carboxyltransferase subunit alpha [Candidatus Aphodousia gallistercoris]|nr:acetyl-CoA carboxylase carboxyltransferase subunit alpha [Candidatus Aphodousia gallistercoris]
MAKLVFLDFEKQIEELHLKIDELSEMQDSEDGKKLDISSEIEQLKDKTRELLKQTYAHLTPWQTSLVARHPQRPYMLDYIEMIFTDFHELHGDRAYADDASIVGGLARLAGQPVMVIGHQKGRDTKERMQRNFGMSRPEGYRKALRLMKLAEKFSLPIFTFVDTPGAYPGIGAEERGQSEAIGHNIYEMSHLKTPIIVTIIGEGGSGGALAIAVGDVVNMLQYSIYSVISPEGCASILWKDASRAPEAAQALGLTADRLRELGLVDRVLTEPLGGAHRDPHLMGASMKKLLTDQMRHFLALPVEELVKMRLERLLQYGKFEIKALEEAQPIEAGVQAQAAEQARSAEPVSDTPVEAEKTGETEKPAQTEPEKEAKRTVRKRTVRKTDATKKTASKKA